MKGVKKQKAAIHATLAVALAALALPASANALACEGILGHEAAIYKNPDGTGFIKNKYPGELIKGPGAPYEFWTPGSVSPWIEVYVSERPNGYMDVNYFNNTDCLDPW
ncbi:MAG: hypothetical protein ACTHM1_06555 [Solirubrobacteraceae bacterium]